MFVSQDHIIYYWDWSYSSRCEKYKLCEGQIKWYQGMFVRVLAARVVFIEGARAFKDKKHIPKRYLLQLQRVVANRCQAAVLQLWWEGVRCVVGGVMFVVKGVVVSVGGVEVGVGRVRCGLGR